MTMIGQVLLCRHLYIPCAAACAGRRELLAGGGVWPSSGCRDFVVIWRVGSEGCCRAGRFCSA